MNGNTLRIRLKKLDIELQELAEKLGISPQNLQSKLNTTDLKLSFVQDVSNAINISLYNLIEDNKSVNLEDEVTVHDQESIIKNNDIPLYGIPLIEPEAVAGLSDNSDLRVMLYETEKYYIPLFKNADFLIPVRGNSMQPKYNSGDLLACVRVPAGSFFQWNKVYVLDTVQGPLVKRVKPSLKKNHILAISENKDFDPVDIPTAEITAFFLVIGFIGLE